MKILKNDAKFEVLTKPENVIHDIALAARTCYQSQDKSTPENDERLVKNLLNRGHEAMIEFANMNVRFSNVSRYLTHELCRHRLASYAQASTRYISYDNINIKTDARCKFNIEKEKNIVDLYLEGKSTNEISKKFGCAVSTIINILKKYDINIRNNGDLKCKSFNPFLKENIDCISAQILGFIYANGNIYNNKKKGSPYTISIKIKDFEYLKQIEYFIGGNIYYYKDGNIWKLQINSKTWFETIKNIYGCFENKSLIINGKLLDVNLPKELLSHFIRGFFEGDGSIGNYNNKKILSFYSGSKPFLEWIKNVILTEIGVDFNKILKQKNANCYTLRYQSVENIKKIVEWMYKDFSFELVLLRKLIIADSFVNFDVSKSFNNSCNKLNIIPSTFENAKDLYNYIYYSQMGINYYNSLKGMMSNDERRVYLPSNIKTQIVVGANLREWLHIFDMRCDKFAHWEIRTVMLDLLKWCKQNIPLIFDNYHFFTTEDGKEYARRIMSKFQLKETLKHYFEVCPEEVTMLKEFANEK